MKYVYKFVLIFIFSLSNFKEVFSMNPFGLDPEIIGRSMGAGIAEGLSEGLGGNLGQNLMHGLAQAMAHDFAEGEMGDLGLAFLGDGLRRNIIKNIFLSINEGLNEFAPGREGDQAFRFFGDSLDRNIGSKLNMVVNRAVVSAVLGAVGIATAWYGSKVLWQYISYKIFHPNILIDSSKSNYQKDVLKIPMIFSSDLQNRLQNLIKSTKNIHTKIKKGRKNVKYRNLLLYGPPGTGKTMFAKRLAYECGMEFAMMTGSSLAELDIKQAIGELNNLFRWAKKGKGLLLFIDEIDTLLCKRENIKPDSREYIILNHFLALTGEQSDRFMLVGATNKFEILDDAMERRFTDIIQLPLPEKEQRAQVVQLYCDSILFNEKENSKDFINHAKELLTPAMIDHIANKTTGLSNGDLQNRINVIQTDTDITDEGLVTQEIIDQAIRHALEKHQTFLQAGKVEQINSFSLSQNCQKIAQPMQCAA